MPSADLKPRSTSSRIAAVFASVWVYLKLALGLLLVALLVIFVVQNVKEIHVEFLVWKIEMSQALVVFLALLSGAALGGTISSWIWWRSSKRPVAG